VLSSGAVVLAGFPILQNGTGSIHFSRDDLRDGRVYIACVERYGLREVRNRLSGTGIAADVHQAGLADRIAHCGGVRVRQDVIVTEDILHSALDHQRAERAWNSRTLYLRRERCRRKCLAGREESA